MGYAITGGEMEPEPRRRRAITLGERKIMTGHVVPPEEEETATGDTIAAREYEGYEEFLSSAKPLWHRAMRAARNSNIFGVVGKVVAYIANEVIWGVAASIFGNGAIMNAELENARSERPEAYPDIVYRKGLKRPPSDEEMDRPSDEEIAEKEKKYQKHAIAASLPMIITMGGKVRVSWPIVLVFVAVVGIPIYYLNRWINRWIKQHAQNRRYLEATSTDIPRIVPS